VEAAIIRRGDDGGVELLGHDAEGELAIRAGWGSMFRTYLGDGLRYRDRFVDGWYLSGDRALRDPDGWYWFLGRGVESVVDASPRDAPDLNFLDLRIWLSEPRDHRS
jgi:acetyl-CoA synthetase